MHSKKLKLAGWGNFPIQLCQLLRPEKYCDLQAVSTTTIARGSGRSYGDAALNQAGFVLLTERLDRILAFDKCAGILRAEAGVTLAEILALCVPHGWFLPVVPGTQTVSLGGCVASNVHGKNQQRAGSFSRHVIELELITADQTLLHCSKTNNVDYFAATIGGMGLTGIIGTVTLQLVAIETAYLTTTCRATTTLEQTLSAMMDPALEDEYSVAWLDLLHPKQFGRGLILTAHHTRQAALPPTLLNRPLALVERNIYKIPGSGKLNLLSPTLLRQFNAVYYRRHARQLSSRLVHYQTYFFPLDKIINWNYLYGQQGFTQFQCVLPTVHSLRGMQELMAAIRTSEVPIYLAVLKRFGASKAGFLSFPMAGFTLALDIPLREKCVFELLNKLHQLVIKYAGRVYLAKDATMTAADFRQMYADYPAWLAQKKLLDPHGIFSSSLSRRLQLGA